MSWAQCPRCWQSFTSVTGFDKHQEHHYGTAMPIVCLDPATLGMERNPAGRWHFPATDDSRRLLAKMRASQPPAGMTGRGQA